ncbi:MAG: histidine--tRNA ligase [Desulfobacteraceae bacterium]|nr:histidine--tRNA ligase [Desulfobacteraceae bacterium]
MSIKALKGFKDILPEEAAVWQRIEATARDIFHRFGFAEIKVPILEKTELFARSIGEATDIVEKEMYSFTDRNGESVTMRPEGTASVLRAFIEHGLHVRQPVNRLYTIGPMFRHERPQKGRLRQFHQLSVEALGSEHPRLDAEVMAMAALLLTELGLTASLEINSLGCPACRPAFKESLVAYAKARVGEICDDCVRRSDTNPLRVLDCKNEQCRIAFREAPSILDHLCADCRAHFAAVEEGLGALAIPYRVNPFMVRGLDYYSRTTFELLSGELGAQSAVGAGGRYDGLVAQLGGPALPGIGFAMGMERLVLLMQQAGEGQAQLASTVDVYVAALGEAAGKAGFRLLHELRRKGVRAAMDHEGRSLKSQMKQAGRLQARYVFLLGEEELKRGELVVKEMATGEQTTVALPGNTGAWCETVAGKIGL